MNTYKVIFKNRNDSEYFDASHFYVDENNNLCFVSGDSIVAMVSWDDWCFVEQEKQIVYTQLNPIMDELLK